jgi:4'-phosphopantetheinyl transferase
MSPRAVSVSLFADDGSAGLLEAAVAGFAGVPREAVSILPLCEHCGGAHGKPRVIEPRTVTGGEFFVSKSRAAGTVAVGVTDAGPLGIDIESLEKMSRARVDEVAFALAERALIDAADAAERNRIRTRLWSRKEAYLKATGEGLRRDLVTVDVTSSALGAVFAEIATGDDSLVGYVAVLGEAELVVELVT